MAETIIRLKVESSEYEQKLKRASQSLLQMAENAKRTGAALDLADREEVEFVRSLGKLQTTATTTRGKVSELSQAFTELSVHYRQLDDATKNSDYGKALSSSLDEIKKRAQSAKQELGEVSSELNNSGESSNVFSEVLGEISNKLGINITSLGKYGVAVAAAGAAIKVAKEAFMNSEINIDAWARTVEGAKGAYSMFLDTINGGNWDNFFQNLQRAIQGSRELADAMDRMESVKNNNAAAIAQEQATIQGLRSRKYKGEDVDAELEDHVQKLYNLQMEGVEASLAAARKSITEALTRRVSAQEGGSELVDEAMIQAMVDRIINEGQSVYDTYTSLLKSLTVKGTESSTMTDMWGKSRSFNSFNIANLGQQDATDYILGKALVEGETEIAQSVALYAEAIREQASVAKEEVNGVRYALTDVKTEAASVSDVKIFPEGSLAAFNQELDQLREAQKLVTSPETWRAYEEQIEAVRVKISELTGAVSKLSTGEKIQMMIDDAAAKTSNASSNREANTDPGTTKLGEFSEMLQGVIDTFDFATGEMSNLTSGLEKMGVSIPASVNKAVNALEGLSQVMQVVQTVIGIVNAAIIANTAAQTANAAAEAADPIFEAAKFLLMAGFSNGGVVHAANGFVVPGTSYSGDKVPALLNSGEVVLNRAQQGNLASQLSDKAEGQSASLTLSGEQIYIVLNNYLSRSGIGKIVTK